MIRYPDADIEIEYKKEKAKQRDRSFKFDMGKPQVLREQRITGASSSIIHAAPWDPDAWNNSLRVTAPIEFKEL